MNPVMISAPSLSSRAFSTLGCADLSLEQILDLARRHQIDAVEIRGIDGTIKTPERLEELFASPNDFKARFQNDPVRICALDTSFRLAGNTDSDRATLLRYVPWVEAMGIPRLRVFDGSGLSEATGLSQALDALSWWRGLRAQHGWQVDLMVETHSSLTNTPALLNFLSHAPADTSLLWDSHHTWRLGGESPEDTWRAIGSRVVHIHVKDSVSKPDGKNPYTYVPCGQGEFPMRALRHALIQDAYRGVVSLEWERLWHPELPSLDHALSSASIHNWW